MAVSAVTQQWANLGDVVTGPFLAGDFAIAFLYATDAGWWSDPSGAWSKEYDTGDPSVNSGAPAGHAIYRKQLSAPGSLSLDFAFTINTDYAWGGTPTYLIGLTVLRGTAQLPDEQPRLMASETSCGQGLTLVGGAVDGMAVLFSVGGYTGTAPSPSFDLTFHPGGGQPAGLHSGSGVQEAFVAGMCYFPTTGSVVNTPSWYNGSSDSHGISVGEYELVKPPSYVPPPPLVRLPDNSMVAEVRAGHSLRHSTRLAGT